MSLELGKQRMLMPLQSFAIGIHAQILEVVVLFPDAA